MKDGQVKVQFIRANNTPVGAIAAKRNGDVIHVAISSISAKSGDRFDKTIGKKIALGRLEKNRGFVVEINQSASEIEVKRAIYQSILNNTLLQEYDRDYVQGISSQARKAIHKMYKVALQPKPEVV